MTIADPRRRAAELRQQIKALVESAEKEDRELNAEETALFEQLRGEAESLDRRAALLDKVRADVEADNKPEPRATTPSFQARIESVETQEERQRSFADFLVHIAKVADSKISPREREQSHDTLEKFYRSQYNAWDKRALAGTSGVTGGYTVPTDFYAQIMEVAGEMAIVRPRALVLPMTAYEVEIPLLDQTTAPSAGNTAFYGGIAATWTGEAATISEDGPGFRQAKLTAHELTGLTYVSRSLLNSSPLSLDALVTQLFGRTVAWYEDYAFLRGNGIGKPLGVLNAPAFLETGTARGSATAISFANVLSLWTKTPQAARGDLVFLASHAAEPALLNMAGTTNSVFVPVGVYASGPNAAALPINYSLLGRPVIITEKLPGLNTLGDFIACSFSHYVIGDPQSLEIATSEHYRFANNQIAYRFVHRVGGMPWLNDKITLADASTTVSPFAGLTVQ